VLLSGAGGSAPEGRRPAVVLQHDRFNRTKLATAVVVAITSRLKYAELPGNVRLRRGEAGLSKASVVNVTQVATIDRALIGDRIGSLTAARLRQVWSGVCQVCEPD
jgi:mRNA interferase MazF